MIELNLYTKGVFSAFMEPFIPRTLEKALMRYFSRKEIIGIRGARQVGKTTLLKKIQQQMGKNSLYLTMDLPENRRALEETPLDLVQRWKKENQKMFLFLDEIQKANNAGEKLKIIYDRFPEVKIFISGSSSLELKTKVLPALVGRLLLFEMYPFSFAEFLSAKDSGLAKLYHQKHKSLQNFLAGKGKIDKPAFQEEYLHLWKEYALFGGYPEIVKSKDIEEKKMLLKNIFNLYLEKDIVSFFKIEDTTKFEDFLKAASFTIGQLQVLSSLAGKIHLPYQDADRFMEILQHTYVIRLLPPFHKNVVTEIKKSPKLYFLDTGLRNAILNNFSPFENRTDAGQLAENVAFQQLLINFSEYELRFWRTTGKAEVDFVLSKDEELIPIEVKLTENSIGKSFHSFLEAYHPKKAIIITLDHFSEEKINNTTLYKIPIYYL